MNMDRFDCASLLNVQNPIGLELGVASGIFTKNVNDRTQFAKYIGVDAFIGHHSEEFLEATKVYADIEGACLVRSSFEEYSKVALSESYDFIYIDGFAHTGEEGGKTISDFWSKLRIGGVMAGDDYHSHWPLVQWAVADFANKTGSQILLTKKPSDIIGYNAYPSWLVIKKQDVAYEPSKMLQFVAIYEKYHVFLKMKIKGYLKK